MVMVTAARSDGRPDTIRALVEEGVLAEASGLEFFGLREHHIEEMPLSAPDMVLASVAARTSGSGSVRPSPC